VPRSVSRVNDKVVTNQVEIVSTIQISPGTMFKTVAIRGCDERAAQTETARSPRAMGWSASSPPRSHADRSPIMPTRCAAFAIEFAITRTVRDAAALLDAVAGSEATPQGLPVGLQIAGRFDDEAT